MKSLVLALLFLYLSDANAIRLERSIANVNEFVDKLFENSEDWTPKHNLDPFFMKSLKEKFWFVWLWRNNTGEVTLKNITTYGLSKLYRVEDAAAKYDNKMLTIDVKALVKNLKIDSDYTAKFLGLQPKGRQKVEIKNLTLFMNFSVDFCYFNITINDLEFRNNGKIKIDLQDGGVMGGFYNLFVNVVTSLFDKPILKSLSEQVATLIREKLADTKPFLPPSKKCSQTNFQIF